MDQHSLGYDNISAISSLISATTALKGNLLYKMFPSPMISFVHERASVINVPHLISTRGVISITNLEFASHAMVEGHQVHRVAAAHSRLLLGRRFAAASPNKRFVDGAAVIHGKYLIRIEAHGKNLFYFFSPDPPKSSSAKHNADLTSIIRVHFGMSGRWRFIPVSAGVNTIRSQIRQSPPPLSASAQPLLARSRSSRNSKFAEEMASASDAKPGSRKRGRSEPERPPTPIRSSPFSPDDAAGPEFHLRGPVSPPSSTSDSSISPDPKFTRPKPILDLDSNPFLAGPLKPNRIEFEEMEEDVNHDVSGVASREEDGAMEVELKDAVEGTGFGNPTTVRLLIVSYEALDSTTATSSNSSSKVTNAGEPVSAQLSCQTLELLEPGGYESWVKKLGEDPLREDTPDSDGRSAEDRAWDSIRALKRSIGHVLMDQDYIGGVGNIYRAEILFKSGIHPETPCNLLSREHFSKIWMHSAALLRRGFTSGSILTVDPDEAKTLGPPWTRRYIYNHAQCGRCKSSVMKWDMGGRTVYACLTCQPFPRSNVTGTPTKRKRSKVDDMKDEDYSVDIENVLTPARLKALRAAVPVGKPFLSHCAPEDGQKKNSPKLQRSRSAPNPKTISKDSSEDETKTPTTTPKRRRLNSSKQPDQSTESSDDVDFSSWTVERLRSSLRSGGHAVSGNKAELIARMRSVASESPTTRARSPQKTPENPPPLVVPGAPVARKRSRIAARKETSTPTRRRSRKRSEPLEQSDEDEIDEGPVKWKGDLMIASAKEAREEKRRAGENDAVEHVALTNDIDEVL
ncbi:hypothetical protein BJ742DRAFT_770330 [Cladochytrium replicatum]|nr:hypothetical protein BJ742DRAFT_770330 [Cladochytrium replicatum]